jgi:hypothetical protein
MVSAQFAMMLFVSLIPMLGMMQARRMRRAKITFFMPKEPAVDTRRQNSTHFGAGI